MERCKRCVLPLSQVEHDDDGVCMHCLDYNSGLIQWDQLRWEFHQIADQYRGRGDKYDFMVPLTGGKDSSYVLYYMTKVLNARVLAFTWDNGLIREQAWENMRNAVKATGVDHQVFRFMDFESMKRVYLATFKSFGKVCFCPMYTMLCSIPTALELKIPLIVMGFSEGQREMDHSFQIPTNKSYTEKLHQLHSDWKDFFTLALTENEPDLAEELLEKLMGPLGNCVENSEGVEWPKFIPMANYIDWMSSTELEATLAETLNYKKAAKTTTHTSCIIEPVKGYLEHKRNLTEMAMEISCFVRHGVISREEGLKEAESMGIMDAIPEEVSAFNKLLGISMKEFKEYSVRERNIPPFMREWATALRARLEQTLPWIMGISKTSARAYK